MPRGTRTWHRQQMRIRRPIGASQKSLDRGPFVDRWKGDCQTQRSFLRGPFDLEAFGRRRRRESFEGPLMDHADREATPLSRMPDPAALPCPSAFSPSKNPSVETHGSPPYQRGPLPRQIRREFQEARTPSSHVFLLGCLWTSKRADWDRDESPGK